MDLTGEPDGPPTKSGLSLVDYASGFCSALGLMCGIYKAQQTGRGCDVDVSLLDTAVSMLAYLATWHLNKGFKPQRMPDSAHPTIVPSQNFPTQDGWMVVMCQKQKFWELLCQAIEREDLLQDPRFQTMEARYQNRDALIPLLKEIFKQRPTGEWIKLFKKRGIPCEPVNTFEQVFCEPQIQARDMIVEVHHPVYGKLKEVGCPIKVPGEKLEYKCAPSLGMHTEEILTTYLGYSREEIVALRKKGVI